MPSITLRSRSRYKSLLTAALTLALGATCALESAGTANAETGADVSAFASKWDGRPADYDASYGEQCVDLFNYYNRDFVHAPFVAANVAADIYDSASTDFYEKLDPSAHAAKGYVAVWTTAYPNGTVPPAGHVAIVLADNGLSLTILTQNPGPTHRQQITKNYLRGYLRPKNLTDSGLGVAEGAAAPLGDLATGS